MSPNDPKRTSKCAPTIHQAKRSQAASRLPSGATSSVARSYAAARVHRASRRCGGTWPLRSARSKGSGCGGWACSWIWPRTILTRKPASRLFVQGLQEAGWAEGRNVRIDTRWSGGESGGCLRSAAELVALGPDVIIARHSARLRRSCDKATRTIPIVFAQSSIRSAAGFVDKLGAARRQSDWLHPVRI